MRSAFYETSLKGRYLKAESNTDSPAYNIQFERYLEGCKREDRAVDGFRFSFRSPTYFASLGSNCCWMFPEYVKVFSDLMRCGNMFSDGRLCGKEKYAAYKEWSIKNVGVSEYELWTKLAVMRGENAMGFADWVTYEN